MPEPTTIATFYKGWQEYQERLARVVASLTDEQLYLSAAPALRPVGLIATHIVSVRAGWMHFVLEEKDDRLPALAEWSDWDRPFRRAEALVSGLQTSWEAIDSMLNRMTVAELDEIVWDTEDDGTKVPCTRQWVIWHLIEHDMHHGGELSYTLGMHDLPGIDI